MNNAINLALVLAAASVAACSAAGADTTTHVDFTKAPDAARQTING